jgi:hypothetical protein
MLFGGVEVSGCRPLSALFIYRQRVQMNFHQDLRTVNYEFVSLPIWRRLICERWRARQASIRWRRTHVVGLVCQEL